MGKIIICVISLIAGLNFALASQQKPEIESLHRLFSQRRMLTDGLALSLSSAVDNPSPAAQKIAAILEPCKSTFEGTPDEHTEQTLGQDGNCQVTYRTIQDSEFNGFDVAIKEESALERTGVDILALTGVSTSQKMGHQKYHFTPSNQSGEWLVQTAHEETTESLTFEGQAVQIQETLEYQQLNEGSLSTFDFRVKKGQQEWHGRLEDLPSQQMKCTLNEQEISCEDLSYAYGG